MWLVTLFVSHEGMLAGSASVASTLSSDDEGRSCAGAPLLAHAASAMAAGIGRSTCCTVAAGCAAVMLRSVD